MKVKIENWSVTRPQVNNPYLAPEHVGISVQGHVHGHPDFEEGSLVVTSNIDHVEGRTVFTVSGRVYLLDKVHPDYRKWLRENRPDWDWRNPITVEKDGAR